MEFLGFRYHGWQKQAKLKTIQGMVDKTLEFVLNHKMFRTLGCGRTDARVSADDFVLELFLFEPLKEREFLALFNDNLPADIRALSLEKTNSSFNIIQNSKVKEYHYYFCTEGKYHPANAPFITNFGENINLTVMREVAKMYSGAHNFKWFTADSKLDKEFTRTIISSFIEESNRYSSPTSPNKTYVFKVRSKGFMRYQVRLMMGALELLGRGKMTLYEFQQKLNAQGDQPIHNIVPGSGLVLHKVEFTTY